MARAWTLALLGLGPALARIDSLSPTDYLTLAVDCRDSRIRLTSHTLDPFSGVLVVAPSSALRRGGAGPGGCRAEGRGRHQVSIEVGAGRCGWRRQGSLVTLDVYMQYDPHLQQVIDERLVVQCDMAGRVGTVRDAGLATVTSGHTASIPLTAVHSWGPAIQQQQEETVMEQSVAGAALQLEEEVEDELDKELELVSEEEVETVVQPRNDIYDGSRRRRVEVGGGGAVSGWLDLSRDGGSIQDPLEEGQVVRLSAKVRPGLQDTLLTRCMLATEAGDLLQLTDQFGCSLDTDTVTHWSKPVLNDITGVKETVAQLKVPTIAFGKRIESVKIKCNLAVCEQDCPIIKCDSSNPPISVQDSVVLETQALFARREIMNAVDEVEHEVSSLAGAGAGAEEGGTLCLSPTRLVLAFGVLIVVIIASLLLSCYLWIKARKRMLPRPPIPIQRVPYMMPSRARPGPYIRVVT